MNLKYLKYTALLIFAAATVSAADKPDGDSAARNQMEEKLHAANDRLNEAAREIGELTAQLYGDPIMLTGPRVMLGVNVDSAPAVKADTGVRVISVSPGGPAANAGIKTNDVIVSLEGRKVLTVPGKSPRQVLLADLRDVQPGSPIAVELQRDGKIQSVKVIPTDVKLFMNVDIPPLPPMDGAFAMEGFPKQLEILSERFNMSGFGSGEFVELTPGLGRYFGTDKGLLVVHPPKDSNLKLEEGDVILDIDGRVPTNGSHALRILNSYRAGESLKLHIMRQQKRIELAVEMPAEKVHASLRHGLRFPTHDNARRDVLLLL
jgi:predicted metalloprotease with PDZ domain